MVAVDRPHHLSLALLDLVPPVADGGIARTHPLPVGGVEAGHGDGGDGSRLLARLDVLEHRQVQLPRILDAIDAPM
ncbi:MAG TPA: hypothetical protein DCS97_12815, partial [Planctomycetes bacterium]|nr:hypothetical protein [Planctomycetota bacterium]